MMTNNLSSPGWKCSLCSSTLLNVDSRTIRAHLQINHRFDKTSDVWNLVSGGWNSRYKCVACSDYLRGDDKYINHLIGFHSMADEVAVEVVLTAQATKRAQDQEKKIWTFIKGLEIPSTPSGLPAGPEVVPEVVDLSSTTDDSNVTMTEAADPTPDVEKGENSSSGKPGLALPLDLSAGDTVPSVDPSPLPQTIAPEKSDDNTTTSTPKASTSAPERKIGMKVQPGASQKLSKMSSVTMTPLSSMVNVLTPSGGGKDSTIEESSSVPSKKKRGRNSAIEESPSSVPPKKKRGRRKKLPTSSPRKSGRLQTSRESKTSPSTPESTSGTTSV